LVFAAINGGKPPLEMVWKHLEYLSGMAQDLTVKHLAGFLHDLHCTYAFLQDNTLGMANFGERRSQKLWLNIASSPGEQASLKDVRSSWKPIRYLVLSTLCDSGLIEALKSSLARYEKLLRVSRIQLVDQWNR
jgi:hypothetical protein